MKPGKLKINNYCRSSHGDLERSLIVHLPLLYLQCVNPEMFFTASFFNGNGMCMV